MRHIGNIGRMTMASGQAMRDRLDDDGARACGWVRRMMILAQPILVWLCAAASMTQAQVRPASQPTEPAKKAKGAVALPRPPYCLMRRPRDSGVARISLDLPDPIIESDLERWYEMLSLSEAQKPILDALWRDYQARDERMASEIVPALWRQSSSAAAQPPLEAPEVLTSLYRERDKVARQLVGNEEPLFAALQDVLSDEQQAILPRVRQTRKRQTMQFVIYEHQAAGIDLSEILYRMKDVAPVDPQAFDQVLQSYEQSLTALLTSHYAVKWRATDSGQQALSRREEPGDPMNADSHAEYLEVWKDVAQAQKRIVALNRLYVEVLADGLSSPQNDRLRATFEQGAFPSVYPDDWDLRQVFRALDEAALDDELRLATITLRDSYERRHDAASDRMIQATIDYTDLRLARQSSRREDFDAYKVTMDDLQTERIKAAEECLASLRGIAAAGAHWATEQVA